MDLLSTKLYMPPVRANLVPRPMLWQRLDAGLDHSHPLALVCAPAGYGKTTLVAAWLQQHQPPGTAVAHERIAWLSLDQEDNAPRRFFAYVMAALERAGVDWGDTRSTLQELPTLPPPSELATLLLNHVSAAGDQPLLLVLDDYHKIETPIIHETLQFWVEHAPPFVHLVIASRADPPLPLARWRVQDRLTEMRAGDLQFDGAEAATFLQQTMGLALPDTAIAALEQRTEGWIAGLQLAAIALGAAQNAPGAVDAAAFIESFSGSHHYVIDYLVEEVLRQQPPAVRDFLQQTAVLERLSAPLCNAVIGRTDSQAILTYLDRANLFLVPLDNQQRWYRTHHLLADSLRVSLDEAQEAALRRRAAAWYEAAGEPETAVRHALATGDMDWAAALIERVIQNAPAWTHGNVGRLTGWLEALPEPLLRSRPALSLHASRAYYLAGQVDRAAQLLAQGQRALESADATADEGLLALAAVYRGAIAALHGENLDEVVTTTRDLLSHPAPLSRHTIARAADTLGLAHELRGEVLAAERAYLRASDLAAAANVAYLAINARCEAALVQINAGQLDTAANTVQQALDLGADIPPAGLAWAILGEIARERNDLQTAVQHLTHGIHLSQQGHIIDDLRTAYLFLARLRGAEGDFAAAVAAGQQAETIMQGYGVPRLQQLAAAQMARLDLAQGQVEPATQWANRYVAQRETLPYKHEFEDLTLARVWLAARDTTAALALLQAVLAAAQADGRGRTAIEALILQAVAQVQEGNKAAAVGALRHALGLAAPQGFARLFLDEGPTVTLLLPRARSAAPDFVDDLLAAAAMAEEAAPDQDPFMLSPALAMDPLSEREQEVLNLLVSGLSNDEIASELVITVGTAKWHVHNIYQKLEVNNRAQAIARAHEWRLV